MVERADILGHAFRQEDAVRATGNRGAEIVERKTARQRIDADIAQEAVSTVRLEKVARETPGGRAVRGGDRVFEIEDQRVGAAVEAARQFPFAIGRDEQHRAHEISPPLTPSPPLGAERVGVRWGIPGRSPAGPPHAPIASQWAPPSPP